jgi:hypothetical protein
LATSVNVIKLLKENNRPLGETSPNLVTLILTNWFACGSYKGWAGFGQDQTLPKVGLKTNSSFSRNCFLHKDQKTQQGT